jgi:two-component system, LuxR family, sensor histidine kinase DctS
VYFSIHAPLHGVFPRIRVNTWFNFPLKSRISIHEGILIAFLAGIGLLMWLLYQHELELHRNDLIRDMSVAESTLTSQLEADQIFAEQLARERAEGALTREQFETRVSKRTLENAHIVALLTQDPDASLRWSAPATRSSEDLRRLRAPLAEQDRMLRLTATTGRASYSEPFTASDGRAYIEYAAPVIAGNKFLGTVNTIFALHSMHRAILPDWFAKKYEIAVTSKEGALLAGRTLGSDQRGYLTERRTLTLPWRGIEMQVSSQPRGSALASVTVGATIMLLTSLIAWSFYSLRRESARRSASEQSTRAANERFETVLDSLNVAVYVSDENSNELLYSNEHFRDIFPGMKSGSVAPFEDQFEPNPSTLFYRDGGQPTTAAKSEIRHTPSNRWFIARVRRFRWVDGRSVRLHTLGDVTDRVDTERINRAQQERLMLTSRLMTAGEMASTLAHEINQPLAAITNYLNGCVQRLRGGDQNMSVIAPAIEKASVQAERAGNIIHRVREFVRTRDPQREPIDVMALIDDVTRFSEPDPTKPTLQFVIEIESALPKVLADRIMIEQVLLNLTRNAREAMSEVPDGAKRVILRAHLRDAKEVTISVSDVGSGIAPEVAANLFSPFVTTKSQGMGMGLSICRSIIEYHEGQMRYLPNVPRGTTFEFTLPIAEDE